MVGYQGTIIVERGFCFGVPVSDTYVLPRVSGNSGDSSVGRLIILFWGYTLPVVFILSFFLAAFPDKLHEMLSQESSDDPASAIVSWLPHGRAFIVRKPKEFTTEVMPK